MRSPYFKPKPDAHLDTHRYLISYNAVTYRYYFPHIVGHTQKEWCLHII
jgi:hypothetical protein